MKIASGALRADDMPEELLNHVVSQEHAAYAPSSHAVWGEVLRRNRGLVEQFGSSMHPAYLEGLRVLDLPQRVPRIEEINERIADTGWKTVCVDGYIPSSAYAGLMASSIFPISRVIRRAEHIDYAPAPDMVHDIFGHLPMLFSPEHREFLKRLAQIMTDAVPNALDEQLYFANRRMSELKSDPGCAPESAREAEQRVIQLHKRLNSNASELTHLSRLYLWSVEFGLLADAEGFRVYGAALLSSPQEFRAVCEGAAPVLPYSLDVVRRDISFSDLQSQYFVARDFAHLHEVLESYQATMQIGRAQLHSEIRGISPKRKEVGNA
jgi:phenylalanine-4-hydroxylase